MRILKATTRTFIPIYGALLLFLTHHILHYEQLLDQRKPFCFFWVLGGTALIGILRNPAKTSPFQWIYGIICCAFTLNATAQAAAQFDVDHLDAPFFLLPLYLIQHFILIGWIFFKNLESHSDRGLYLCLFFLPLGGIFYFAPFFLPAGLACTVLFARLYETRTAFQTPGLFMGAPFLLILLFCALSTGNAQNFGTASRAACYVGACAVTALIIFLRKREEGFYLQLFQCMLWASVLPLVTAFLNLVLVGQTLGFSHALSARLFLLSVHPNFIAPYLSMIALIALRLGFTSERRFLLLFAPVPLAALILTDSRAGFLGFGAGLLLMALLSRPINKKAIVVVIILCLCMIPLLPLAMDKIPRLKSSLNFRLDVWSNSLEVIKEAPILGIGLDNFRGDKEFSPDSAFSHQLKAQHPHNLLLYICQSCGIFTLIGFLWLVLNVIRRALTMNNTQRDLILSVLAALLASSCFDLSLSVFNLFPFPIWLFAGMAMAQKARPSSMAGLKTRTLCALALLGVFYYAVLCPMMGRLYVDKSFMAQQSNDLTFALKMGKKALDWYPYLKRGRDQIINICYQTRDFKEAQKLMEASVRQAPDNSLYRLKLGSLYRYFNEPEKAALQYEKAVEMGRGSLHLPNYYAALINLKKDFKNKDEVNALIKEAIRRNIAVINLIQWDFRAYSEKRDERFLKLKAIDEEIVLEDTLVEMHEELKAGSKERYAWWSLFQAFFNTNIHDRALNLLNDMETVFSHKENELSLIRHQKNLISEKQSADAHGFVDKTNPVALIAYQFSQLKGEKEDLLLESINFYSKLRDYKNFRGVYEEVLGQIIGLSDDPTLKRDYLKKRLFFASEKKKRGALLLDLAACLMDLDQYPEAEGTIKEMKELVCSSPPSLTRTRDYQDQTKKAASLLRSIHQKMELTWDQSLSCYGKITASLGPHPVRVLFDYHFYIKNRQPQYALAALDPMPEKDLLFLNLKQECYWLLDQRENTLNLFPKLISAHEKNGQSLKEQIKRFSIQLVQDQSKIHLARKLTCFFCYLGEYDKGLNVVYAMRKSHPKNIELLGLSAWVQWLKNNRDAAIKDLKRALSIVPEDIKAAMALKRLSCP